MAARMAARTWLRGLRGLREWLRMDGLESEVDKGVEAWKKSFEGGRASQGKT